MVQLSNHAEEAGRQEGEDDEDGCGTQLVDSFVALFCS